jgi:phosphate transport system permease protein
MGEAEPQIPPSIEIPDDPRELTQRRNGADRVFFASAYGVGIFMLVIFAAIGIFLALKMVPTLKHYHLHFFTEQNFVPGRNVIGIAAATTGTIAVALIALAVGFPLAITTSLYISEYAPARVKNFLALLVNLMAAVPSIIYGLWGFFLLEPRAADVARFLSEYLAFIPIFKVSGQPGQPAPGHSASLSIASTYFGSMFIVGIVVAMMIIPIASSVMIGVFEQAPLGEREAAYALGSTRWGMIRSVVLPFGRGGIIGGTMLGLGRALGETIAVLLILSPNFVITGRILHIGGATISAMIAGAFGEATNVQLDALLAAGFVLFVMTLIINVIAGMVVTRSRSGAATEI